MNYIKPYNSCYLFGALRTFANLKECIHLIHGPSGCSFFNISNVLNLNGVRFRSFTPKIFSTDFNDDNVVFGGSEKLDKAIREIVDKYNPKVVFVYNCCITEVIGENVENICEQVAGALGVRIIPIRSAGFKGDNKVGMREAAQILFDNFIVKNQKIDKTINILGELDVGAKNVAELCRVLQQGGVKVNAIVPGNASIEELNRVSGASLNYVLCGSSMMVLAEKLKEEYSIPYIFDKSGYIGAKNCYQVLDDIFSFFQIETNVHKIMYEKTQKLLESNKKSFENKKAILVLGTRKSMGFSCLLNEMGISVKSVFFEELKGYIHSSDVMLQADRIILEEDSELVTEIIKTEKPDYVLTTIADIVTPEPFVSCTGKIFSGFLGVSEMIKQLQEYDSSHISRYLRLMK